MASILDGLGLEGSILDGLDDWPGQLRERSGSTSLVSWWQTPLLIWIATRLHWPKLRRRLLELVCCDFNACPMV